MRDWLYMCLYSVVFMMLSGPPPNHSKATETFPKDTNYLFWFKKEEVWGLPIETQLSSGLYLLADRNLTHVLHSH
jgi:hypothetical protein